MSNTYVVGEQTRQKLDELIHRFPIAGQGTGLGNRPPGTQVLKVFSSGFTAWGYPATIQIQSPLTGLFSSIPGGPSSVRVTDGNGGVFGVGDIVHSRFVGINSGGEACYVGGGGARSISLVGTNTAGSTIAVSSTFTSGTLVTTAADGWYSITARITTSPVALTVASLPYYFAIGISSLGASDSVYGYHTALLNKTDVFQRIVYLVSGTTINFLVSNISATDSLTLLSSSNIEVVKLG